MSSSTRHNLSDCVLLVDDDQAMLESLARTLITLQLGAEIICAHSVSQAIEIADERRPLVAVIDLAIHPALGVESGFNLLKALLELDRTIRVIVLTGHGDSSYGVRALDLGAGSFLEKPANPQHLKALVTDGMALARLRRSHAALVENGPSKAGTSYIGKSPAANKVRAQISFAATTNQPILITGETGTGKGLCARLIHELSARSTKRFVRYQPTFASADLVNSELFGHLKGAFTGAAENRYGLFSEAQGGTLFLDELDELPPECQVLLLGVLQERNFRALGATKEQAADFRLIAATNSDLEKSLNAGKMRRDFYHRIAHEQIHLPTLRERLEDIPDLVEFLLEELRTRERVDIFDVHPDVFSRLSDYPWPGNVRELGAIIEGAAYRSQFAGRRTIKTEDIVLGSGRKHSADSGSFHEQTERFKLRLIEEALQRQGGNQVRAAESLGLDRSSLRRILARKINSHHS